MTGSQIAKTAVAIVALIALTLMACWFVGVIH